MSLYGIIVGIHVIAAVVGMGPAFAFPIISKIAKNKEQLILMHLLMEKIEKPVKIGSLTLLATGLIMGALNTYLFTQAWYITSIILYFVAQIFVIGVSAKAMKQSNALLEAAKTDEIPDAVLALNKKSSSALNISSIIAVVMILLMSLKPF